MWYVIILAKKDLIITSEKRISNQSSCLCLQLVIWKDKNTEAAMPPTLFNTRTKI